MEACSKLPLEETTMEMVFKYFAINLFPEVVGILIVMIVMFFVGLFTKNLDSANFWVMYVLVILFMIIGRIVSIYMGLM